MESRPYGTRGAMIEFEVRAQVLGALQMSVMERAKANGTWYTDTSEFRGEQTDEAVYSLPGALIGDVPLSEAERSEA